MKSEMPNNTEDIMIKNAADLYWLALLLTGRQDISVEIAAEAAVSDDDASPFFADWMRGWQRRLVIGRALAEIRDELSESALRIQLVRINSSAAPPPPKWSLNPETNKADLERALLAIDLFPRTALLLLVFEGIRLADAATLLDADPTLIRKAQAIGLRELTANLASKSSTEKHRGSKPVVDKPTKLYSWLRVLAICH